MHFILPNIKNKQHNYSYLSLMSIFFVLKLNLIYLTCKISERM